MIITRNGVEIDFELNGWLYIRKEGKKKWAKKIYFRHQEPLSLFYKFFKGLEDE